MAIAEVKQTVNLGQAPQMFQNRLAEFRAQIARTAYGASVEDTVAKAAAIVNTWRTGRKWVMDDPMVSNAVIDVGVALLDETALQALADLRTAFDKALAEYKRKLEDPAAAIAPDAAMRIWARVERQLAAGVEFYAIVAEETDLPTLTVIAEEIKSWRRAQMPGDLQSANFIADGDLELVNARRYELATVEQRARMDRAKASSKGEYNVNLSLGAAEHHIRHLNDAEPGRTILPEWNGNILRV